MLLKDVAKKIQDDLNLIADNLGYADVVFNITDNIQRYESDMKNSDDVSYTPCVVKMNGSPFKFESLDITVRNYELSIYGFAIQRHKVEKIVHEYTKIEQSNISGIGVFQYASELFIDEFLSSQDGYNKKRFDGRVDIELQIPPTTITGHNVNIKVDDIVIPFRSIRYRKDKSIISNIPFNDSSANDVKMVSDTIEVEIPVTDNSDVLALFSEMLDATYNKTHVLSWAIGSITKVIQVTMRVGTMSLLNNNNPLTFWVTFELALPRKTMTIDRITFPVLRIGFTGEKTPSTYPRNIDGNYVMKSRILRFGTSLDTVIVLPNYEEQTLEYTISGSGSSGNALPFSNTSILVSLMPMTIIDSFECLMIVNNGTPQKVTFERNNVNFIRVYNDTYDFNMVVVNTSGQVTGTIPFGNVKFIVPKNIQIIKAQELIDEIKNGKATKTFRIRETKLGKQYEHLMYLVHGNYEDTENPDMFVTCTFIDADEVAVI